MGRVGEWEGVEEGTEGEGERGKRGDHHLRIGERKWLADEQPCAKELGGMCRQWVVVKEKVKREREREMEQGKYETEEGGRNGRDRVGNGGRDGPERELRERLRERL